MLTLMISEYPLRNRVKELRERVGLRQADLADAVGITRQTIIAIEKGRLNPSIVISLKVARMLREPVDYVFYLAAGTEASTLAVVNADGKTDGLGPRKGKKGRPKGSGKAKAAGIPVEEAAVEVAESAETSEADEIVEVVDADEIGDAYDDAEGSAPAASEVAAEEPIEVAAPGEEPPSPAYEAVEEVAAEMDDIRYELDRDAEAVVEEPQVELDVPEEIDEPASEPSFSTPTSDLEDQDSQSQIREGKSGQAIWDFF